MQVQAEMPITVMCVPTILYLYPSPFPIFLIFNVYEAPEPFRIRNMILRREISANLSINDH